MWVTSVTEFSHRHKMITFKNWMGKLNMQQSIRKLRKEYEQAHKSNNNNIEFNNKKIRHVRA